MSTFRLTPSQLLDIQVRAFANSVPQTVLVGKHEREVTLTESEREAAKLAVWYILKRAWGHSSAVSKASGSFDNCNKSNVKRALDEVFPEDYFKSLERSKNNRFYKSFDEEGRDDQNNAR